MLGMLKSLRKIAEDESYHNYTVVTLFWILANSRPSDINSALAILREERPSAAEKIDQTTRKSGAHNTACVVELFSGFVKYIGEKVEMNAHGSNREDLLESLKVDPESVIKTINDSTPGHLWKYREIDPDYTLPKSKEEIGRQVVLYLKNVLIKEEIEYRT